MLSSPSPRQPEQSDDNLKKHPESSSLGALRWHLPVDQSLAWETDTLDTLSLGR